MDGPCRSPSLSLDLQGQAPPCLLPPVRWAPGLASKAWLAVLRARLPRGPGLRLTDGYAAPPCPRLPVWGRRSPCFLGGPGDSARLRSPGPRSDRAELGRDVGTRQRRRPCACCLGPSPGARGLSPAARAPQLATGGGGKSSQPGRRSQDVSVLRRLPRPQVHPAGRVGDQVSPAEQGGP